MSSRPTELIRSTIYSTEFRWTGDYAILAHRRISDVVNDNSSTLIVLRNVTPAIWENNSFRELQPVESMALVKDNIVAIFPGPDSSSRQVASAERVQKQVIRVFIYAPPLLLLGNIHIARAAEWAEALGNVRTDFIPLTNVNTWYLKSGVPLDTNLRLALIHRRHIIGLEPKNYLSSTAATRKS